MKVERHETLAAPDAYAANGGWLSGRSAKVITYHALSERSAATCSRLTWCEQARTGNIPAFILGLFRDCLRRHRDVVSGMFSFRQ